MEVIAALHSQLSAANAELESIQQQTNQNAKDILRLESDNKTKAQRLLHVQEETVSLRAQLDEEANTIVMLERQIESALAEQDALTRVNNAMLPSVLKSLEKNREKMRRLKATINVLLGETSRSSYLEEQTKLVQLQIQQFREDCNGNNKVNNSVPVAEFDERYFMKCIEEEESKMAAGMRVEEIENLNAFMSHCSSGRD